MTLQVICFWVFLILAGVAFIAGWPEERRNAWAVSILCLIVDTVIIGFRLFNA